MAKNKYKINCHDFGIVFKLIIKLGSRLTCIVYSGGGDARVGSNSSPTLIFFHLKL